MKFSISIILFITCVIINKSYQLNSAGGRGYNNRYKAGGRFDFYLLTIHYKYYF